jgi:Divergent InlB B-repeat domain
VRRAAGACALVALLTCAVAAAAAPGQPAADALLRSRGTAQTASASTAAPTALAAWCGAAAQSDRAPNIVAGSPIHWVYLIPSDGADNLGSVATVMQSDAEQIDAWWRGQDSARAPRNDLAGFPCGTQLDITTVRSTLPSSQLAPLDGRFPSISQSLQQAGLTSSFTKYLVYYDGPSEEGNVCGQGGSANPTSGQGLAVVYYRSCLGISTAAVAAHEFLHTTGAVPTSAPHACSGDTSGHVCDTEADIMYPFIGDGSLSAKLLDPGRDDYYGHAGAWTDSQDSSWLVRLDGQTPLAVTISGPGSVAADVPGMQCAATCTTTWNVGQHLTLSATPGSGAKLVRWEGACSGNGPCAVDVAAGVAVTAFFAPAAFRLTIAVKGRGTVRSSDGIRCKPQCSATLPSYRPARLTATPAKGWKLRAWSGACKGAKRACTVPMSAATSVRATFVRR